MFNLLRKQLGRFTNDSLFRNSVYLMISTASLSFFGFIFWIINARLYSTNDVGLATTIISISTLIANLSVLGLQNGLIRFLPKSNNRNAKISLSFLIVVSASILISTIYLIGIENFSEKLLFIKENFLYTSIFIVSMVFISLNPIIESVFIAFRSSGVVLSKNIILGVTKIILPTILISMGSFGIFSSFAVSFLVSILFSIIYLKFYFSFKFVFNLKRELLAKLWKFSFANYVISIIGGLPSLLLPIIITNRADPSMSGFFYIDMMITNLLFTIPIATTQALFAEGSHNEDDIQTHLKKTILIIAALLFPSILVVYFSGSLILSLFGKEYAENGLQLLQLLAVSSLFSGIIYIGNTLLNIRQKINKMIMINAFSTLLILGVSSLLITKGLAGIGIAFLVSQAIVSVFHVVTIRNELRAYVKA